jgi:integrase/recombinase XerD
MSSEDVPSPGRGAEVGQRVGDLIPAFLDHLRVEENRSAGTIERYDIHLRRLAEVTGDRPVSLITADDLHIYRRRLLAAGLSAGSIAGSISAVRSFFRFLRDIRGLSVLDPVKIRRPKIPQREVEYLTKDEVLRFLDVIPTERFTGLRDRALVEVLASTGMRIAEALSLDRGQIDWDRREAKIIGKGNKERKVYFSDRALDWLVKLLVARRDDHPAIFVTNSCPPRRCQAGDVWRRFRRYGKKAGIAKRVHPHIFRHTMATTLLANGCPIGHIRVLLGHEHLSTTCKYYLGLMSDAEAKAAHAKYLSYEVRGDAASEDAAGREPIAA